MNFFVQIVALFLFSCAIPNDPGSKPSNASQSLPDLNLENGVEVVTWNIENFPKMGRQTIDSVVNILRALNADIYCLQEIGSESEFLQLAESLNGYEAIFSTATQYLNLAILYRSESILMRNQTNILEDNTYEFAYRPPLQVGFTVMGDQPFDINLINVHLKCCDNGYNRRLSSVQLLHEYLLQSTSLGLVNTIVAGDWNDDLSDPYAVNAFNTFIDDQDNFRYVTWDLANSDSDLYDSFPGYPSFIDHILISSDLFDEAENSDVQTIRLGDYISNYDQLISDHRPVAWRFTP